MAAATPYHRSASKSATRRKPRSLQLQTPEIPTRQFLFDNGSDPHPTTGPFVKLLIAEGLFSGIQVNYVKRGETYVAQDGASWKSYFPMGTIPTARLEATPCLTGEPEPNLYLQVHESAEQILKGILTTIPCLRASLDAGIISCAKTNFYPMQRGQQAVNGTRIFMNTNHGAVNSKRHQVAMQYFHQHLQSTVPINIYVSVINCSNRGQLKVNLCCSPANSQDTQLRPLNLTLDKKEEFDDATTQALLSKFCSMWAYSQQMDDESIVVFDV